MKKRNFTKIGFAAALAGLALIPALKDQSIEGAYIPRENQEIKTKWEGAQEIYRKLRAEVGTEEINPDLISQVEKETRKFLNSNTKSALSLQWSDKGPDNVGGRTRAITVDVNNTDKVYAGSVSGGLFVSLNRANTWTWVQGFDQNLAIGAMDMTANGTLVVGTGSVHEGFPQGFGGSDFRGDGLFVSTDGVSFSHAQNSQGGIMNRASGLVNVNEIIADPKNDDQVWIGASSGIFRYNPTTGAVFNPIGAPTSGCTDISVSADGNVILAVFTSSVFRSKDGGANFTMISENATGKLPRSGISRVETSISQDDANYMYALIAASSGQLLNAYGSNDGGDSWIIIMPGNAAPYSSLFGTGQGGYDNVISAIPGSPGQCIIGGVTLWMSGVEIQAEQIALNFAGETDPLYVHSDIHEFTWSPDGLLYIGCDGGVHVSDDKARSFYQANRFYNVTQFYSTDFSGFDEVIGGAQDNGTQYIDGSGVTAESAREVLGGDGFDCEISAVDNNYIFASLYNGAIYRSNDKQAFAPFYDNRVIAEGNSNSIGGFGLGGFFTQMGLYENTNSVNAQQFIPYVNAGTVAIPAGTTLTVKSESGDIPQTMVLQADLAPGDTVLIRDKVESIFAAGFGGSQGYWITRNAIQFNKSAEWIRISNLGSQGKDIEFSADGDIMFYSDWQGGLYRVANLNQVWSLDEGDVELGTNLKTDISGIYNTNAVITGIAIDQNDKDHIAISIGGYGGGAHVMETFNATAATPTFTSIQGDLPSFPVYDVMFMKDDASTILIGTEYGVYSTKDGSSWTSENNNFPITPVFEIEQQWRSSSATVKNEGTIYAGTHGRGIWKSESYTSVNELTGNVKEGLNLNVYPNPTSGAVKMDLTAFNGNVFIQVMDLQGKTIINTNLVGGIEGELDLKDVEPGMYMLIAADAKRKLSAKISVQ